MTQWIETHDADAVQLGKPLYLGEFSLPDSPVDEADTVRRNELCARHSRNAHLTVISPVLMLC
eukprot:6135176-Prymnesium_polylepis.2